MINSDAKIDDDFVGEIFNCLTNVQDENERIAKSNQLASMLAYARAINIGFPNIDTIPSSEMSDIYALTEGIIKDLRKFEEMREKYKVIDQNMSVISGLLTRSPGVQFEVKPIMSGLSALLDLLDTGIENRKPGPNNKSSLRFAIAICQIYDVILGKKPGCYEGDRIAQSGDLADGTPFERLCYLVKDKYGIPLAWKTCKKASSVYTGYFNPYKVTPPSIAGRLDGMKKSVIWST